MASSSKGGIDQALDASTTAEEENFALSMERAYQAMGMGLGDLYDEETDEDDTDDETDEELVNEETADGASGAASLFEEEKLVPCIDRALQTMNLCDFSATEVTDRQFDMRPPSAQEDVQAPDTGLLPDQGPLKLVPDLAQIAAAGGVYSTGIVLFVYDNYFDFSYFAMRYPGSKVIGVGQLHDWEWHINERGHPNIRHALCTPLEFQNLDIPQPPTIDAVTKFRPASTYGYIFEVSQETLDDLNLKYENTHQRCIQYVQFLIGDKSIRSACYIFYDARYTSDQDGVNMLLDPNEKSLWSRGFQLMKTLDVPLFFRIEVLKSLEGNPRRQRSRQDAYEQMPSGLEKLVNLHEYMKEVESRSDCLEPVVRPTQAYLHSGGAEQGQEEFEPVNFSEFVNEQDDDEGFVTLPPFDPADGNGQRESLPVQPRAVLQSLFPSSSMIAAALPAVLASREAEEGNGEALYKISQNDDDWNKVYAQLERPLLQSSNRQADNSLVLGIPKRAEFSVDVDFCNRKRNQNDIIHATSLPNPSTFTSRHPTQQPHNTEDLSRPNQFSATSRNSLSSNTCSQFAPSPTPLQGPTRGYFSSSKSSAHTTVAPPLGTSRGSLSSSTSSQFAFPSSSPELPTRGYFSPSKVPKHNPTVVPSGTFRQSSSNSSSQSTLSPSPLPKPSQEHLSQSKAAKHTPSAAPSASSKHCLSRSVFSRSPLREPSRGYISPPAVPKRTSALVKQPSSLRYTTTMTEGSSQPHCHSKDDLSQFDGSSPHRKSLKALSARSDAPSTPKKARGLSSGDGKSRSTAFEKVRTHVGDNWLSPDSSNSASSSPDYASSSGASRRFIIQPASEIEDATLGKMVREMLSNHSIAEDADLGQKLRALVRANPVVHDEAAILKPTTTPVKPRMKFNDPPPTPEARAAFWQKAEEAIAGQDQIFKETGLKGRISWTSKHGVIESGKGFVPSEDIVDLMKKLHGKDDDRSRAKSKECMERCRQQMATHEEHEVFPSSTAAMESATAGDMQSVAEYDHPELPDSPNSRAAMTSAARLLMSMSMAEPEELLDLGDIELYEIENFDDFLNELSSNMDDQSRAHFQEIVAHARQSMGESAVRPGSPSSPTTMQPAAASDDVVSPMVAVEAEEEGFATPSPKKTSRQSSTTLNEQSSSTSSARLRANPPPDTPSKPRRLRKHSDRETE